MSREILTDEQIESEVERLTKSPYVELARAEQRLKYRKRQYLSTLRNLEKRGMELDKEGFDPNEFEEDE